LSSKKIEKAIEHAKDVSPDAPCNDNATKARKYRKERAVRGHRSKMPEVVVCALAREWLFEFFMLPVRAAM